MASSNIHLYTASTPNGIKISITLEELGLPYQTTKLEFSKNEQKEPWFLEINPNGRIPAITDTFSDGKTIRIFESGSIMQYLVERYDKDHKLSFPPGTREHVEMTNWLFFMNAGVGPMQGQSNHFTRYTPEPVPYGISRYQTETRRLYRVLDTHLARDNGAHPFLVGGTSHASIADLAHWPWVAAAAWAGVDIDDFPALKAWEERVGALEGVKKGSAGSRVKDLAKDPKLAAEAAKKATEWVQAGMKADLEATGQKL